MGWEVWETVVVKFEELISQIKADHKIQKIVEEPLSINTFTTGKSTGSVNAEKYLIRFLDTISPDDPLLDSLYEDLAKLASYAGDYDKSVQWYQKGLALQSQKTLSTVSEINKSNNST
ncbi:unnamed protein product, partial [Rotaria sp. Silwood2]